MVDADTPSKTTWGAVPRESACDLTTRLNHRRVAKKVHCCSHTLLMGHSKISCKPSPSIFFILTKLSHSAHSKEKLYDTRRRGNLHLQIQLRKTFRKRGQNFGWYHLGYQLGSHPSNLRNLCDAAPTTASVGDVTSGWQPVGWYTKLNYKKGQLHLSTAGWSRKHG